MKRRDLLFGLTAAPLLADTHEWLPEGGLLTDVTGFQVARCMVILREDGPASGVDSGSAATGTRQPHLVTYEA